jgi:hypothetical protein
MYKKHYDHLRACWNVFFVVGEKEDFDCSFDTALAAQEYCDMKNRVTVNAGSENVSAN